MYLGSDVWAKSKEECREMVGKLGKEKCLYSETLTRSFLNHYRFNLELLPTKEEVEGMRPTMGECIRDFAYKWRLKTSTLCLRRT